MTNKSMIITSKSLSDGGEYSIGDYELDDNGLYSLNKQRNGTIEKFKICDPIFVEGTIENIDTKDYFLILVSKINGQYKKRKELMDVLIPQKLLGLLRYGIEIPPEFEKIISRYLLEQRNLVSNKLVYSNIGCHEDENKELEFRLDKVISNNHNLIAVNDEDNLKFNLSCNGTLEKWLQMYLAEVKGHTSLETMICISFSSVIVGYLKKTNKDADTIIVHLCGKSTTGKTTVSKLALSPFGLPDIKDKGLLRTWNATTNAMINSLGGNFGVPMVFDELSMVNQKNITKELYTIATGLEKARLNDSISQRHQQTWATTIISTGEQSIFERTSNNAGLRVRSISFDGVEWTKSAENAEHIKAAINENYGYAGVKYVKYIFEQGFQIMDSKFQIWKDIALEAMPDSDFKDRIANKFAIILTAGDIANEALELDINLEEVLKFLSENEAESIEERDFGKKAFNEIVQVIIQNNSKFKKYNNNYMPYECWGKIENDAGYYQVMILKNILQNKLRELNNEDPKVVIKEWKAKKYIISEGDRVTIRRRIFSKDEQEQRKESLGKEVSENNLADTVYILKIPKEQLQEYINPDMSVTPVH